MMSIESDVLSDPNTLGGTLCFSRTRVPVRNFFDYLEGGSGIDTFLESFDWISKDQLMAVLEHSANNLKTKPVKNARY